MESEHRPTAEEFEAKLTLLIAQFETARERAETLKAELESTRERLEDAQHDLSELRMKYHNLKLARMVGFSEKDKKDAYLRITNLMQKIDDCLELLND